MDLEGLYLLGGGGGGGDERKERREGGREGRSARSPSAPAAPPRPFILLEHMHMHIHRHRHGRGTSAPAELEKRLQNPKTERHPCPARPRCRRGEITLVYRRVPCAGCRAPCAESGESGLGTWTGSWLLGSERGRAAACSSPVLASAVTANGIKEGARPVV